MTDHTDEPPCLGGAYGIPPRPSRDAAERAWCRRFAERLVEITAGGFTFEQGVQMAKAGEIDLSESPETAAEEMLAYLDADEP